MKANDFKPPVLIQTLDQASITIDSIGAIQDAERALDPITPGHAPFAVQTHSGQIYRVAASELRRIFGSRRRRGPVPVGGVRPEDV